MSLFLQLRILYPLSKETVRSSSIDIKQDVSDGLINERKICCGSMSYYFVSSYYSSVGFTIMCSWSPDKMFSLFCRIYPHFFST
uniref:Uncharacterized protein n=1 Tax=Noccaea caerulescens TaxID=107243 RepID=A0A1J3DSE7_NOCCA